MPETYPEGPNHLAGEGFGDADNVRGGVISDGLGDTDSTSGRLSEGFGDLTDSPVEITSADLFMARESASNNLTAVATRLTVRVIAEGHPSADITKFPEYSHAQRALVAIDDAINVKISGNSTDK